MASHNCKCTDEKLLKGLIRPNQVVNHTSEGGLVQALRPAGYISVEGRA